MHPSIKKNESPKQNKIERTLSNSVLSAARKQVNKNDAQFSSQGRVKIIHDIT